MSFKFNEDQSLESENSDDENNNKRQSDGESGPTAKKTKSAVGSEDAQVAGAKAFQQSAFQEDKTTEPAPNEAGGNDPNLFDDGTESGVSGTEILQNKSGEIIASETENQDMKTKLVPDEARDCRAVEYSGRYTHYSCDNFDAWSNLHKSKSSQFILEENEVVMNTLTEQKYNKN